MFNHKQKAKLALIWFVLLLVGGTYLVAAQAPTLPQPPRLPERPQPAHVTLDPVLYFPFVQTTADPTLWIETQYRQTVKDFYLNEYMASEGVSDGWTGSHSGCVPGMTSPAFRAAILHRINYFRAMAGVPAVTGFKDSYNQKAQAAALMMSVNGQLSHDPNTSWTCYSADGDEGAGSANLYLGVNGPSAISGYMADPGSGNYAAGHRRWIIYPQTQYMGTGDIPSQGSYWRSNALWVFDRDHLWGPRPDTRDSFVAWPPPGFVPYQVVYARWSLSYPGADFSGATVTMTRAGSPLVVQVNPIANGYGENTLVWEPATSFGKPAGDELYAVTVSGVVFGGQTHQFQYNVILFDPYA